MVRLACIVYVTIVFFAFGGKCFDILEFNDKLFDNAIEMNRVLDPDSAFTSWIRMIMKLPQFSKFLVPNGRQSCTTENRLMPFSMMGHHFGEWMLNDLEKKKEEERVYTIATFLGCDCMYEYIDEDGIYRGFHVDLLNAVCREAGKKCVNQVVPQSACLTHRSGEIPHAGSAILGKQIDICLGWSKTSARTLSVDYTEPFVRFETEVLFVVKSGNPNNFDPNDIRGKKIGFEDGYFTDKICLLHARHRIVGVDTMQPHQEVYKDNFKILLEDVRHDRIDAFFAISGRIAPYLKDEFEFIGDDVGCVTEKSFHGIKRKDNPLTWFDETLKAMKENGKYHALCHQANIDHGHKGKIDCSTE
ncbi:L-arginine-binding protein-like isoform X2 [Ptychodera flava]|uniref:L-arginine-binding protein-like isoform X2 n=1 Tax=Ptychodera flava TaxID=63121 RepID=UPI00396A6C3B